MTFRSFECVFTPLGYYFLSSYTVWCYLLKFVSSYTILNLWCDESQTVTRNKIIYVSYPYLQFLQPLFWRHLLCTSSQVLSRQSVCMCLLVLAILQSFLLVKIYPCCHRKCPYKKFWNIISFVVALPSCFHWRY